jgi:hypothetical protein
MGPLTFGSGFHEPGWIHTNVSLNDIVLIVVDGAGDFPFNITGELVYDLTGFGLIEVWVLEHEASNSTAWYEKSTGILINGTFAYGGGDNYTMTFVDTNAQFDYYLPPSGIPGYEMFSLILVASAISIVVVIQKKRKIK